jgi:hypothetical protein
MHQLAQLVIGGDNQKYTIYDPDGFVFGNSKIGQIVGDAFVFVLAFAGVGLLLMIISAGFTMMLSAGNVKKLEAGKSRLTNAIIGFFIIFAAFWIMQVAGKMFGWQTLGVFGS